jgi:hypothetical protein
MSSNFYNTSFARIKRNGDNENEEDLSIRAS